ncbi:hypothetical protein [Nostoc sp. ChiSLP03a]|uniref:hypothetical protein n=1 Tax=Nostoc sp. ChiSLP03a TaxID=3075380 RepID=UPI003918DD0B
MKNFSGMVILALILEAISREPKFLYPMKLIFLGTAFAVCVLSGCSSQGVRRQSPPQASQAPSITSTLRVLNTNHNATKSFIFGLGKKCRARHTNLIENLDRKFKIWFKMSTM